MRISVTACVLLATLALATLGLVAGQQQCTDQDSTTDNKCCMAYFANNNDCAGNNDATNKRSVKRSLNYQNDNLAGSNNGVDNSSNAVAEEVDCCVDIPYCRPYAQSESCDVGSKRNEGFPKSTLSQDYTAFDFQEHCCQSTCLAFENDLDKQCDAGDIPKNSTDLCDGPECFQTDCCVADTLCTNFNCEAGNVQGQQKMYVVTTNSCGNDGECSRNECCDPGMLCNQYLTTTTKCPPFTLVISNPPPCQGLQCQPMECCQYDCQLHECVAPHVKNDAAVANSECALVSSGTGTGCTEASCCIEKCDSFACEGASRSRVSTLQDVCDNLLCTSALCCQPRCSIDFTGECEAAEPALVLKDLAIGDIWCEGETCTTEECCDSVTLCGISTCTVDTVPVISQTKKTCLLVVCTNEDCCGEAGVCSGRTDAYVCPGGQSTRKDAAKKCRATECTQMECCSPSASCSTHDCGDEKALHPAPETIFCDSAGCDDQTCCGDRVLCADDTLTVAAYCENTTNWALRPGDANSCIYSECAAARDELHCCGERQP
jgi:hypothetical protein